MVFLSLILQYLHYLLNFVRRLFVDRSLKVIIITANRNNPWNVNKCRDPNKIR